MFVDDGCSVITIGKSSELDYKTPCLFTLRVSENGEA